MLEVDDTEDDPSCEPRAMVGSIAALVMTDDEVSITEEDDTVTVARVEDEAPTAATEPKPAKMEL